MDRFSHKTRAIKAAALMGLVATGSTLATGCAPMTYEPHAVEQTNQTAADPYDQKVGVAMSTYTFHNFIGSEPDIVASTAEDDLTRYHHLAVDYLQNRFDDFNQSVANRPGVKRYFARFDMNFSDFPLTYHHREMSTAGKLDYNVNQISAACAPVFSDMVRYSNAEHRAAFILIMRAMMNEARKTGTARDADLTAYQAERDAIAQQWSKDAFLRIINLNEDLDHNHCRGMSEKLYTLHYEIVNNMQKDTLLENINYRDLQRVTDLALLESSLSAAHDYTTPLVQHPHCDMNLRIIQTMENTNQLLNYEKETGMSL